MERLLPADFDLTASYVLTQTIRQSVYLEANAGQTPGLGAAGQPLYTAFGRAAETQEIVPFGTARYNGPAVESQAPIQARRVHDGCLHIQQIDGLRDR